MNPRALFFCVAATLSCGVPQSGDGNPDGFNPPIGGDPTASGSRLKLQVLAGEDGSRQALGFWDSKLNEACYALRDEKGDLRCFYGFIRSDSDGTKRFGWMAEEALRVSSGC